MDTCPRRHKLTKIDKVVVEPQTEYLRHGNEVHKALEKDVSGEQPLPEKYKNYMPIVERVKKTEGKKLVEYKFGITESFKPTNFFSSDVWCRGVIDLAILKPTSAVVLDWKTGKPKDDSDQLKLFAAAAFTHFPYVNTVYTGFVWLQHGKIDTEVYTRDSLPVLWQSFLPRVQRLRSAEQNDDFPPKPSGLCKAHCPVTRKHCEFSGRV